MISMQHKLKEAQERRSAAESALRDDKSKEAMAKRSEILAEVEEELSQLVQAKRTAHEELVQVDGRLYPMS